MKTILIHFALKYNGDWDQIYQALERKEKVSINQLAKVEEMLKNNKWSCITILDIEYPQALRDIYKPPFVIWTYGNIELLKNIFYVSYNFFITKETKKVCKKIFSNYDNKYLPIYSSFDEFNPKNKKCLYIPNESYENKLMDLDEQNNLLIADFPPSATKNYNSCTSFRIMASFASALIVISSNNNQNFNNLVNEFRYLGKNIYCYIDQNQIFEKNNLLIKNGAKILQNINQIF